MLNSKSSKSHSKNQRANTKVRDARNNKDTLSVPQSLTFYLIHV